MGVWKDPSGPAASGVARHMVSRDLLGPVSVCLYCVSFFFFGFLMRFLDRSVATTNNGSRRVSVGRELGLVAGLVLMPAVQNSACIVCQERACLLSTYS